MSELLTREALLDLAGSAAFKRGEQYAATGRVISLAVDNGHIAANVHGTQTYHVDLRIANGELSHSCTCPVGDEGICCKHCVAAALVWLEQGRRPRASRRKTKQPVVTMDDVRAHLSAASHEKLVDLLVDQAMVDDRLRQRLLLETASSTAGGINLDTYREAIDDAVRIRGFVDYHAAPAYARRINDVIGSIEELLSRDAGAVIELSEHALRKVERAIGSMDDSDGHMGEIIRRLESLHLAACERVRPDPTELARKLFAWEMNSPWDVFSDASETYATLLGEVGLAEYRELALAEWSRIRPLRAGEEEDPERSGVRFRITHMMETLAKESGDVDALVDVLRRDLSHPYEYLRIAEVYQNAERHDDALDWAERGMKAFSRDRDRRLSEFVAAAYQRLERHEDAVNIARQAFVDAPCLAEYQSLKRYAEPTGDWATWREKALAVMRQTAGRGKDTSPPRASLWLPQPDGSELVRVFLWEKDVDAAWRAAQEYGCAAALWIELAQKRERDHPEDAVGVYQQLLEPVLARTNNEAYREAVELLREIARLMKPMASDEAFGSYLASVRARHKAKRDFVKMIDGTRL